MSASVKGRARAKTNLRKPGTISAMKLVAVAPVAMRAQSESEMRIQAGATMAMRVKMIGKSKCVLSPVGIENQPEELLLLIR